MSRDFKERFFNGKIKANVFAQYQEEGSNIIGALNHLPLCLKWWSDNCMDLLTVITMLF